VFRVQELERTRRFYADALGLELSLQDDYLLGTLPGGTELLFIVGEAVRGTSPQIVFGSTKAASTRPSRLVETRSASAHLRQRGTWRLVH